MLDVRQFLSDYTRHVHPLLRNSYSHEGFLKAFLTLEKEIEEWLPQFQELLSTLR